jgi:hypothetical protein
MCKEFNEKFLEAIQDKSEDVANDLCAQILSVIDKIKGPTTKSDPQAGSPVSCPSPLPSNRNTSRPLDSSNVRRSFVASIVSGKVGSTRVKPEAAPVETRHQTSFDKAMRVRMAELVENNHTDPPANFKREPSHTSLDIRLTERPSWWQLLYHSHGDNNMYDVFLNLKDDDLKSAEQRLNYLSFKNSDRNIPLKIFVFCFGLTYGGTRLWWANDMYGHAGGPIAVVAVLMAVATAMMLILILLLRLTLVSVTYDIGALHRFHPAAVSFYKSRFNQSLDNGVVVAAARLWVCI